MANPAFEGIVPGSVVAVYYHGAQAALIVVSEVNNYSVVGYDGTHRCKITSVSETELRLKTQLGPNRMSVLRHVTLKKASGFEAL